MLFLKWLHIFHSNNCYQNPHKKQPCFQSYVCSLIVSGLPVRCGSHLSPLTLLVCGQLGRSLVGYKWNRAPPSLVRTRGTVTCASHSQRNYKIFLQLRVPITSLQISTPLTVLPVKPPIYIPLHKNLESRAVRMRNRPRVSETNEALRAHFAQTQLDSEKASSSSGWRCRVRLPAMDWSHIGFPRQLKRDDATHASL